MWWGVGRGLDSAMRSRDDLRRQARLFSWPTTPIAASQPMNEMGYDAEGFPQRCRRRPC